MNPYTQDHHGVQKAASLRDNPITRMVTRLPKGYEEDMKAHIIQNMKTQAGNIAAQRMNNMSLWDKLKLMFSTLMGKVADTFGVKNHSFYKYRDELEFNTKADIMAAQGVKLDRNNPRYREALNNWDINNDKFLEQAAADPSNMFHGLAKDRIAATTQRVEEATDLHQATADQPLADTYNADPEQFRKDFFGEGGAYNNPSVAEPNSDAFNIYTQPQQKPDGFLGLVANPHTRINKPMTNPTPAPTKPQVGLTGRPFYTPEPAAAM